MDLEQSIKIRIEQLKTERQQYLIVAEKNIWAYDVAIGELEHLLVYPKENLPDSTE